MKQFDNILICGHPDHVDLKLLEHAADIAKYNRSNVKIIHVITDYPKDVSAWWNVRNPENLQANIVREHEDFLDGLVESMKKLGVEKVSRKLLWGKPIDEVSHEMIAQKQDLVMLVSKNKGRPGYTSHGYSPEELLRRCPCPVWVAQKKVTKRVNRIVACTAGGSDRSDADSMNTKVLNYAAAISKAQDSELHVAHAMPLHDADDRIKDKQSRFNHDLTAFLDGVRNKVKTHCNELLSNHETMLNDEHIHPLLGSPALAIPEFIETNGADLVVMATTARKGLHGFLVASTAEKVLKKIDCPMLVVKPDSFHAQSMRAAESRSTAA